MPDAVDTILDQWARERPDLDRAPMGILGRIARLARAYDTVNAQTFAEFGLQPDEFDVLATLRRHGAPYELNPRELLRTMMVASGTMTHRLDKLEKAKLIQRGRDPTDRRGVIVRLTVDGKRIVDDAVEAHYPAAARTARNARARRPQTPHRPPPPALPDRRGPRD